MALRVLQGLISNGVRPAEVGDYNMQADRMKFRQSICDYVQKAHSVGAKWIVVFRQHLEALGEDMHNGWLQRMRRHGEYVDNFFCWVSTQHKNGVVLFKSCPLTGCNVPPSSNPPITSTSL